MNPDYSALLPEDFPRDPVHETGKFIYNEQSYYSIKRSVLSIPLRRHLNTLTCPAKYAILFRSNERSRILNFLFKVVI